MARNGSALMDGPAKRSKPAVTFTLTMTSKKVCRPLAATRIAPEATCKIHSKSTTGARATLIPAHGAHLTRVELESIQQKQAVCTRPKTTGAATSHQVTRSNWHFHPDSAQKSTIWSPAPLTYSKKTPTPQEKRATIPDGASNSSSRKAPSNTARPNVRRGRRSVVHTPRSSAGRRGRPLDRPIRPGQGASFHGTANGKNDENSSCWIRVSSPWAGGELGGMHIPRIGQEVLIEYINGEVNRPIIVGRVYNDAQMPPWALNKQQALSGFRSRELVKGGGNAASGRSNHVGARRHRRPDPDPDQERPPPQPALDGPRHPHRRQCRPQGCAR